MEAEGEQTPPLVERVTHLDVRQFLPDGDRQLIIAHAAPEYLSRSADWYAFTFLFAWSKRRQCIFTLQAMLRDIVPQHFLDLFNLQVAVSKISLDFSLELRSPRTFFPNLVFDPAWDNIAMWNPDDDHDDRYTPILAIDVEVTTQARVYVGHCDSFVFPIQLQHTPQRLLDELMDMFIDLFENGGLDGRLHLFCDSLITMDGRALVMDLPWLFQLHALKVGLRGTHSVDRLL